MNQSEGEAIACAGSPEIADLLGQLKKVTAEAEQNRIAVCGLMNAGKSALLNALTDSIEQDYFPVGASRATLSIKTLQQGTVTWIDTPGIDACDEDDVEAWQGILDADWILFVHNLRVAALDTSEIAFLEGLKARIPDLQKRLVVVFSHADSAQDELDLRISAVNSLLNTLFPAPLPFVVTSSTRYLKGCQEHKPLLIERSGISQLHQQINALISAYQGGVQGVRAQAKAELLARFTALMNEERERREAKLAQEINDALVAEYVTSVEIKTFNHFLKARLERYNSLFN